MAHDPGNLAAAQEAGGALAAGLTAGAAVASGPLSALNAPVAAMAVHSAYNYGEENAPSVILPLEALATMAFCAPPAGVGPGCFHPRQRDVFPLRPHKLDCGCD